MALDFGVNGQGDGNMDVGAGRCGIVNVKDEGADDERRVDAEHDLE